MGGKGIGKDKWEGMAKGGRGQGWVKRKGRIWEREGKEVMGTGKEKYNGKQKER